MAIRRTRQVGGVDLQIRPALHIDGLAGTQIAGIGEDQRRGDETIAHKTLRAVEVSQSEIQQAGALNQPRLQVTPLLATDDERHQVELPRLVGAAAFAIHETGDAMLCQDAAAVFPAHAQFVAAQSVQRRNERLPVRADFAARAETLVEHARRRLTSLVQVAGRCACLSFY